MEKDIGGKDVGGKGRRWKRMELETLKCSVVTVLFDRKDEQLY